MANTIPKYGMKVFFDSIKGSLNDESAPENTYRLKKASEIKSGFEVYIAEMDDYLLKNNLNGKIKIPRWTREFYLLPKVYLGRELIWGDKWTVHPPQGLTNE